MKRKITVIMAIIGMLAIGMYGCGAEQDIETISATENSKIENKIKIEDKGKQPSEELLEQDISSAVTSTWEHMEFVSTEVKKSMTGEKDYSAEVSIIAESRYATVNLEAEISYLKYDQGWEADQIGHMGIESYEVNNYPTAEEMTSIIEASEEMQEYNISRQKYVDMVCEGESILYTGSVDMDWNPYCHITGTVKSIWWYDIDTDSWKADTETLETDYDYDMALEGILYEGVSMTQTETGFDVQGGGFEPFHVEFVEEFVDTRSIELTYVGSGVNYHFVGANNGRTITGKNEDVRMRIVFYKNKGAVIQVDWTGAVVTLGYAED